MTDLRAHFRQAAAYNQAANATLYAACATLEDEERKRVRPAFFNSIHGTLNHILLGDRIWMGRFEGNEMPSTDLDRILYEDFAELRAAREVEDVRILLFCDGLTDDFLASRIRYVNNAGKLYDDPASLLLPHLFNHQTHHRGQAHGLLSQTAVPPPSLDMHRMLIP
tara:strand:- start:359 stop:856 length:498 start_codon:yes stop_codon:yes gene_type:complete